MTFFREAFIATLACGLGCSGRPSAQVKGCVEELSAGDLVITEVMADPKGSDEGKEWFEIYNAAGRDVDLSGVVVTSSKADGSNLKKIALDGLFARAGQYLVLGSAMPAAAPTWVDFAYASGLGSLLNTSNGRLQIICGEEVIDDVIYLSPGEGFSLSLDGSVPPDAQRNDDPTKWCKATEEYEPGNFGTPGEPNGACVSAIPEGSCWDGTTIRPVRAPTVGTVIISEFLADPKAVSDTNGEWVEVFVAKDMDLNGLQLGKSEAQMIDLFTTANCVEAKGGSWLVFARKADPSVNGGVNEVAGILPFGLTNSGMTLVVGYRGQIIDKVVYSAGWVKPGASTSLDPDYLDPQQNDEVSAWCFGTETFGAGDLGTPGAPNPPCK